MNIKKPERHVHRITVRINDTQMNKLKKEAKKAGVSVGEVIRQCIDKL